MPNVRRRSGDMSHGIGGPIKNAVTQRKDGATKPSPIKNQVVPAKMASYSKVNNAVTDCKY